MTSHDQSGSPTTGLPDTCAGVLPPVLRHAVAATVAAQGMTIATNAADYPLVYANEAFLRMTGFGPGEILSQNCRFLQGPDTDPAEVARIREALAAGDAVTAVLRNYRRDGSGFWSQVSISPVVNPDNGQVTHFIGTQTVVAAPDPR